MASTKTKTATSSRRAEIRKDRQSRREDILKRWDERGSIAMFVQAVDKDDCTAEDVLVALNHLSQWADPLQLLFGSELGDDATRLSLVVAYMARVIQLKEMPYDEYLLTPEWKTKADAAKKKYDYKCALDASHEAEHAHHRTYQRRGHEWSTDLVPLCADCHAKFHDKGPYRR